DDIAGQTAEILASDEVIGWFQGRMEFGPRELGARSILASPIHPEMQARLNEIKDREDFGLVAAVVLEEEASEYISDVGGPLVNAPPDCIQGSLLRRSGGIGGRICRRPATRSSRLACAPFRSRLTDIRGCRIGCGTIEHRPASIQVFPLASTNQEASLC